MLRSQKNNAPSRCVRPTWVCSFVLVAVLIVVWRPVLEHEFVAWDDNLHVYENPRFHSVTWAHIGAFWREPYEHLYIPVTYTVWAALAWLTHRMSPGPFTPGVFHACNLLVHLSSVLVVYRLTTLLLGQRGSEKPWSTAAIAALAALLFGLHPLQVEAIAWVSGLKDVLSGCLSLIALWQYLECVRTQSGQRCWTHYGLGTVAFCLAMLSKPTAVVVPVLGWILATSILGQPWKQATRWLGGWLLVALALGLWTKGQQPDAAIVSLTPIWTRPLIALDAITFYLGKLFWPVGLGPDYGRTPQSLFEQGWYLTFGILPIGLGLFLWWKRRSYWGGWLAGMVFSASLLPVLGFIPFLFQGHSTVADRYIYLALLGPALGWAWVVQRVRANVTVMCLSLLVLGLLGWRSAVQARVWQSTETLFTQALQVNPRSALAHNNLGLTLAQQGRIAEAIVHYQEALQLRPDYAYTHNNLGLALFQQGKLAAAIAAYRQAIQLRPDYANAYNNLGLALVRQGNPAEAIEHFARALAITPHSAQTHNNLGIALAVQGEYAAATQQFVRAIQLQAHHANAYYNLGLALSHQRQYVDAIMALRTALHLRPAWPAAAVQLAWLLATQSPNVSETAAEAVSVAEQACVATHYRDPLAVFALTVAYQATGQMSQAQAMAQQALRLATAAAKADIVAEIQARFPHLTQKDVWHVVP
jgi:Tfp pilus assembly protein PilF